VLCFKTKKKAQLSCPYIYTHGMARQKARKNQWPPTRAESHKQSERTHHTAFSLFFLNNRSNQTRRIDCEEERKWLEESRRSKPRGKTQKGIRNLRDLSLKPELLLSRLPAPSVRLSLLYSLLFFSFLSYYHTLLFFQSDLLFFFYCWNDYKSWN
jgi:hypothetical protein